MTEEVEIERPPFHAFGAVAQLFDVWVPPKDKCGFTYDPEMLLEGGAGTGKSRGALEFAKVISEIYPGSRGAFVRKTRASMNESVLQIFEQEVLWPGHPAIPSKANVASRRFYQFPDQENGEPGTHIMVEGLNNVDRIMSQNLDWVMFFEATEGTLEDWEKLLSRLRNHMIPHPLCRFPSGKLPAGYPWKTTRAAVEAGAAMVGGMFEGGLDADGRPLFLEFALADCNPAGQRHWLNQRADQEYPPPMETEEGKMLGGPYYDGQSQMRRLLSRHTDNPTVTQTYLDKLRSLSGARRDRLFLHKWVSEDGLVYEEFDRGKHMVYAKDVPPLVEYAAGMDFGWTAAGALEIVGFSQEGKVYRTNEVYHTHKHLEWWAKQIHTYWQKYQLRRVICDSAEPRSIEDMNLSLVAMGAPALCEPSKKGKGSVMANILIVKEMLGPSIVEMDLLNRFRLEREEFERGVGPWAKTLPEVFYRRLGPEPQTPTPGFYVVHDTLDIRDPELVEAKKDFCLIHEFESRSWKKNEDGKPIKEAPDDACDDHGCNAIEYLLSWYRKHTPDAPELPEFPPLTAGDILRHGDVMEEEGDGW